MGGPVSVGTNQALSDAPYPCLIPRSLQSAVPSQQVVERTRGARRRAHTGFEDVEDDHLSGARALAVSVSAGGRPPKCPASADPRRRLTGRPPSSGPCPPSSQDRQRGSWARASAA